MRVLVTTANGMFGRALVDKLAGRGCEVRAMVRDRDRFAAAHPEVEAVAADLDRPETLPEALAGVDRVFLCTPMDPRLARRECGLIEAAQAQGASQIVKVHGAVKHDDPLGDLHGEVLALLERASLSWCLVSPSSVMETSLLGFAESIRDESRIYGMSGRGRIGFVALDDVAEAAAHVLTTEGHDRRNYELTGPEALSLFDVARVFSEALGRPVTYEDMPEEAMASLLAEAFSLSREELEINVLCHLRCWRDGRADLVTDTFARLTGKAPTSLLEWVRAHAPLFGGRG